MSELQRVRDVLIGLMTLLFAALMMIIPDEGCIIIATVLGIMLAVEGARRIVYYFTMARHMVDGKVLLYAGVLLLDLGMLTGGVTKAPQRIVMLYLVGAHLFSGVVYVLQSLEERRLDSSAWRWSMAHGLANVLVAVLCVAFIGSQRTMVYVYCAGLVYSACVRIATAFRRTAIIYIP